MQEFSSACPLEDDLHSLVSVKESFEKRWIEIQRRLDVMQKQLEERPDHMARASSSPYQREEVLETRLQKQEVDCSEV